MTMQLGKRSRSAIRRTTSMTEFSSEDLAAAASVGEGEEATGSRRQRDRRRPAGPGHPPRSMQRRSCGDLAGSASESTIAQFLTVCGICSRPLGPGLDTFIYRGEFAFCSQECRQQQLNQDELKNKCLRSSTKSDGTQPSATSDASGNGETIVVA